jgi:hypothetical protein
MHLGILVLAPLTNPMTDQARTPNMWPEDDSPSKQDCLTNSLMRSRLAHIRASREPPNVALARGQTTFPNPHSWSDA